MSSSKEIDERMTWGFTAFLLEMVMRMKELGD